MKGQEDPPGSRCVGLDGKNHSKKIHGVVTLKIAWWNGGGGIQKRLLLNQGLKHCTSPKTLKALFLLSFKLIYLQVSLCFIVRLTGIEDRW